VWALRFAAQHGARTRARSALKRKLERVLFTFHLTATPTTTRKSNVGAGAVVVVLVSAAVVVGAIVVGWCY
jgi:hypothetical protein